jgi:hypothetical protein
MASTLRRRVRATTAHVERTSQSHRDWAEWAARIGLAARGVVYLALAVVVGQIALGDHDDQASKQGAVAKVAEQPFGRALVVLLALGLLCYALWRLIEAIAGSDDDGAKDAAKRAGNVGRAVLYGALFASTLPFVFGDSGSATGSAQTSGTGASGGAGGAASGGSGSGGQAWTARVLGWPGGRWLVGAVGLALVGVGLYNGYRAVSGKYRKKLKTEELGPRESTVVNGVATVGLFGRLAVFGLVGGFLLHAALAFDPNDPVGLDASLRNLAGKSFGPLLLLVLAVALVCYAAFSFAEARWRRVFGS